MFISDFLPYEFWKFHVTNKYNIDSQIICSQIRELQEYIKINKNWRSVDSFFDIMKT